MTVIMLAGISVETPGCSVKYAAESGTGGIGAGGVPGAGVSSRANHPLVHGTLGPLSHAATSVGPRSRVNPPPIERLSQQE
jgi:hypothetical protein